MLIARLLFMYIKESGERRMKKLGKVLMAVALAATLVGCGSNTASEEKEQFVVGMECGYAPFNWQTSESSDTTVSLGNAGYADGYDVQIAKKLLMN